MWGQSFSISGPSNCNMNVSYNYYILLSAPARNNLYFNLKASHGLCSPVAILIPAGQRSGVFSVRWTSETTNGIVTAAIPMGGSATSPGVRVVKEGGVISDQGYTMSGPDVLHVLETGKYALANYTLESFHKLEWHDLYKISNIEPIVKYGNFTKIEDYANITPLTPSSRDGQRVLKSLIKDASGKEIGYSDYKYVKIKEPIITPSTYSVGNNKAMTYTLKDYYPSATITWEAGKNMVLVSGQGTPTATFKASSDGYATVKATVTYGGKSYTVENSSVFVGITYNALYNTIDLDPKELVGTLTLGSEIKGATSFSWGGLFPPQYYNVNRKAPTVNFAYKHILSFGGLYIWVEASNGVDTVKIIYNVTVGGQGGFPLD